MTKQPRFVSRCGAVFALVAPSHLGKLKTLGGGELVVFNKGALLVNMSKPYQADKKATNGILHIMDRVLMPKK